MDMTLNTCEMGCKIVYPRELWVYADDSTDLRSFMRQTERGFAGHFQNSMKHFRCAPDRIKVRSTVRILENLLNLLEGFFILLATIMFSLNPVNLSVIILEAIVVESFVIYGALKLDRRDLLAQTPTCFLMKFVDLCVWLECLVNEVVLRNRELQWLRADRNSL